MDPRLKRYANLLQRKRYPVWSVRTATILLVMIVGICALVVGLIPDLNIFTRMELVLGTCEISLFWMMAIGLYRGARVKRRDLPSLSFQTSFSADDAQKTVVENIDPSVALDADTGIAGAIIAFVVWLVVLFFGGLIIWAFVQFGGWAIVGFIFGLSWVIYRALRQVFARSRQCQGKLAASLGWALAYTTLYTAWLFALLMLGAWLTAKA